MFAEHIIENYNAQIAAVVTEIKEVEAYLADLHAREAAFKEEKQAALSMMAAGQSALEQTRNFLGIARIHEEIVTAFWTKMDQIRAGVVMADLPFSDTPEDEKIDYFPIAETDDLDPADFPVNLGTEIITEDDDTEPVSDGHEEEIEGIANGNGNGSYLTLSDFKGYTLAQLKKIASANGVKTKQGKDALAQDLSTLHLSQEEVDKLLV